MTALIVMLIAAGACTATMAGGLLALKLAGKLPLVMGFSAGAVIGVAFFDLAPEALDAGKGLYEPRILGHRGAGFFLLHPAGPLGGASRLRRRGQSRARAGGGDEFFRP